MHGSGWVFHRGEIRAETPPNAFVRAQTVSSTQDFLNPETSQDVGVFLRPMVGRADGERSDILAFDIVAPKWLQAHPDLLEDFFASWTKTLIAENTVVSPFGAQRLNNNWHKASQDGYLKNLAVRTLAPLARTVAKRNHKSCFVQESSIRPFQNTAYPQNFLNGLWQASENLNATVKFDLPQHETFVDPETGLHVSHADLLNEQEMLGHEKKTLHTSKPTYSRKSLARMGEKNSWSKTAFSFSWHSRRW